MKSIKFYHGPLSDSYEKQANDQGFTFGPAAMWVQELGNWILVAYVNKCITDGEYDKILKRFHLKILCKMIKPLDKTDESR